MCSENHPYADRAGCGSHDHEEAAEAQLDAAGASELGSQEQAVALELARVEALIALGHNIGRIATVLEQQTKRGGALDRLRELSNGRE